MLIKKFIPQTAKKMIKKMNKEVKILEQRMLIIQMMSKMMR